VEEIKFTKLKSTFPEDSDLQDALGKRNEKGKSDDEIKQGMDYVAKRWLWLNVFFLVVTLGIGYGIYYLVKHWKDPFRNIFKGVHKTRLARKKLLAPEKVDNDKIVEESSDEDSIKEDSQESQDLSTGVSYTHQSAVSSALKKGKKEKKPIEVAHRFKEPVRYYHQFKNGDFLAQAKNFEITYNDEKIKQLRTPLKITCALETDNYIIVGGQHPNTGANCIYQWHKNDLTKTPEMRVGPNGQMTSLSKAGDKFYVATEENVINEKLTYKPEVLIFFESPKEYHPVRNRYEVDHTGHLVLLTGGVFAVRNTDKKSMDIWSLEIDDKARSANLKKEDAGEITCAIAYNGNLVTAYKDNTILFWDVNKHEVETTLVAGSPATHLCLSPNGHYLAASTENGSILVWDIESAELIHQQKTNEKIVDLSINENGELACSFAAKVKEKGETLIDRIHLYKIPELLLEKEFYPKLDDDAEFSEEKGFK